MVLTDVGIWVTGTYTEPNVLLILTADGDSSATVSYPHRGLLVPELAARFYGLTFAQPLYVDPGSRFALLNPGPATYSSVTYQIAFGRWPANASQWPGLPTVESSCRS